MLSLSSITSHVRVGLIAAAVGTLLAACGGGEGNSPASQAPVFAAQSSSSSSSALAALTPATIRMHFRRVQHDEAQWGVYSWSGPAHPSSQWIVDRFMMTGSDSFGGYVDIPVDTGKSAIQFLVTDGAGNKNCQSDQAADFNANIASAGQEVWMLEGDCSVYKTPPAVSLGNLNNASAHWLSASTLVWPGTPASGSYKLYYAANGGLSSSPEA